MANRNSRRRQRRRGRFSGLYKLLSVLLILGAVVVGCVVFFRVEEVVISGNQRYTAQEIEQVTGVERGDNLFALNKYDLYQKILTQLPYVEAVSIRRGLPDSLIITVSECQAVGYVEAQGGHWLVNSGGKLLERADGAGLTQITGITVLQPAAGTYLAVSQEEDFKRKDLLALMDALEQEELLPGADTIDLSSNSRIEMSYEGRLSVYFSYAADYGYDAKALQAVIDYLESQEQSVVDLTFDDGPHLYPRSTG